MKLLIFCASMLLISVASYGQITQEELMKMLNGETDEGYIGTVTLGILQGGGSLIGGDLEFLIENKLGLQVGAGLIGYGAAINYHPKGGIRSSFLSLTYWHQGFKEYYTQSLLGPSYVFRGKKWFTAQIGLGFQLEEGPGAKQISTDLPPTQLLYSLGAYFPLR